MKKILVLIISLFSFINVVFAYDFKIGSKNIIMINLNDDSILYEQNKDEKVPIASLTKIITAITVIDNKKDLGEFVTITPKMLSGLDGYAKLGLKSGDKISYIELLYALMLPSAADAAQALAIDMSGSISEFSDLMNEEVNKIGAKNSHFTNPVGIDDDDNYSTAYDLYLILKYALANDVFKTIFETNEYHIISLDEDIKKTLATTSFQNNLDTSIIKGAKTGFTYDAGLCLASTASGNNIDYLIINLGADVESLDYIKDPINLYKYYINNYEYKTIMKKNQLLVTIPIKNGWKKELPFYADSNYQRYSLKSLNENEIKIVYDGVDAITEKIKKGDKLGTVFFKYDDEVLYQYDIFLNEDLRYHHYWIVVLFIGLIILAFAIIRRRIKKKRRKKRAKNNQGRLNVSARNSY